MIQKWFNQIRKKEVNGPAAAVIRFDQEKDNVPTVVASGKGAIALQIIEKAKEHGIPIQEDPVVVSQLIDMDLGENIPPQLYSVIAEILIMIEELEKKL
ncbi:EscU/YscU/HrcU family type III secretion system export apparatus switch protein [Ammoniphilus resinae]|uniref:Flagellar biosynthesis protein n=1 Tax=Ammoniphilus resinae TaxID=861532 RepID=A0ABS4GNN2_9BACL|nr:EscU/YscU/HrcU family type III secretion system export apparatus switch protein [Ammoniphilus resinae]MBP1931480.1 flagellar biosynthesis protein [Ammoniphilus resinae]